MYKKYFIPALVVAGAILVASLMALSRPTPPRTPQVSSAMPVETLLVRSSAAEFEISSQGNVLARDETALVSEVAGIVLDVDAAFRPGAFVEAGQLLLRIDPRDYETAVSRAEATVAAREAQLQQERARAEQAERDWQSIGRGPASALVLRTPFVAEAEANLRAAAADLAAARITLQRTQVRAPYRGLVRQTGVSPGQYLLVGQALGSIAAIEVAEVRLALSEQDAAFLDLPQGIGIGPEVRLLAMQGGQLMVWPARIIRSEGVVDTRSRLIHVVAELDDPYALQRQGAVLPLGSFVEARIAGRSAEGLLAIPRTLLRGANSVLLVDEHSRISVRAVEVVRADADMAWIASGLQVGDQLITTIIESPVEGMSVRVLAQPDDSLPQP